MPEPSKLPAIANQPLSVILFADRSGDEVYAALQQWLSYLSGRKVPFEIFLVDDSGQIATHENLLETIRATNHLHLVANSESKGMGGCLREVLPQVNHKLIAYSPCSSEYAPKNLEKLLAVIDHVELASGCRVGQGPPWWAKTWNRITQLLFSVLFGITKEAPLTWHGLHHWRRRKIASFFFGVRLQDPESPFRLFRRDILKRIPIQSKGSFVNIEIPAKANFLGKWLAEEPIEFVGRKKEAKSIADDWRRADWWKIFSSPNFGPVDPDAPPPSITAEQSSEGSELNMVPVLESKLDPNIEK